MLRNGRRTLVSLHGHEALAGLLIPAAAAATVTGASLALSASPRRRPRTCRSTSSSSANPVVLALVPPRVGPAPRMAAFAGAPAVDRAGRPTTPDRAAIVREALRLRVRWVQELMARAAWELGRRLVDVGLLRRQRRRPPPPRSRSSRPPSSDALSFVHTDARAESARAAAAVALPPRRRRPGVGGARPAGRRRGSAPTDRRPSAPVAGPRPVPCTSHAHGSEVPAGSVLVVSHLDPRLAAVIPRLAGLVAETGSPLSHLAILAREHGVATVVGLADATTGSAG